MISQVVHIWPLIPVKLAMHVFRLVDTPEPTGFPNVHDSHYTTDYEDDVVVKQWDEWKVAVLLLGLLMILRLFLWLFFLRDPPVSLGFWRLATSWPCLDNFSRRATPPSSTSNTVSQGFAQAELERDDALRQVGILTIRLECSHEVNKVLNRRCRKLRDDANGLVYDYNQLAGQFETIRFRSHTQTEVAKMLLVAIDRRVWRDLGEYHRRMLARQVRENFFTYPNHDVPVARAHPW